MIARATGASLSLAALLLLGSCGYLSLNMGRAEPLAAATRGKALGSFPVQGACSIYNPMAGGITFNPLSTDGSNIDDPSSMGCAARLEFTPEGSGLLVTVGSRLERVDWRTGKVVWSRTLVPGSGYGWSVDKQWLVVSEEYGDPERACTPLFEAEDATFCDPMPKRRVRPQTLDPATGAVVVVNGVAKTMWSPTRYWFGVAERDFIGARGVTDLRTGLALPTDAPGEHFATGHAVEKRLKPKEPSPWLGPTDFDPSLKSNLWLRFVPDQSGTVCVNKPLWSLEVAAYREGSPAWSYRIPCVSPYGDTGAWYSTDGQHVGVQYSRSGGARAFEILVAGTGVADSRMERLRGEMYARFVATTSGSPLTKLAGYRVGPVTSATGIVAMLAYDPELGMPFRFAYVGDIASGEIITRHDFGVDEENDGRHPSIAISRDGKLLALFDTTGTVTVVPSGAP